MPLAPGSRLGPYEIVASLGAGGMGEVYRAKDTRLGREVAIKILPAHVSSDTTQRQRFEREAKAISALNHPNICTLFDVGHQDGVDFLVMELVEGETLLTRLEKGPLPTEQALKIGRELAEALDKAHRGGIVHRDIKPGNIMLTKSGAKLLDFGLARPAVANAGLATLTVAVDVHTPVTQEGTIVGTYQYMSPEQIEGKELDGRSDLFSLGAVLYEMVTGQRAFSGKTQLSVASAILEKEPAPISSLQPMAPEKLDHTIRRCLAKDRDDRWQTARDLAGELKWAAESSSGTSATPVAAPQRRSSWLAWGLCVAFALLAGGLLLRGNKSTAGPSDQRMYFSAPFRFPARSMAFSPDGKTVALAAYNEATRRNMVWLYDIGSADAKPIKGTEDATFPFWSPDGKYIAFFANGKLQRMDLNGGPVQVVCNAIAGRGGTWNKDGVILFQPNGALISGLYTVAATGGTPVQITKPDERKKENSHRWPQFLPDGKHFLYLAANVSGEMETDAIYLGALDSNEKKFVVSGNSNPVYVAPGYLLYLKEQTLVAQKFDLGTYQLTGDAVAILSDVEFAPRVVHAKYAVSEQGSLVAQRGGSVTLSRLAWFDRNGKDAGTVSKPDAYANPSLGPDGKSVAFDKEDPGARSSNVYVYSTAGDSTKRLTFDAGITAAPVWSGDGKYVAYIASHDRLFDMFEKPVDGGGEEKRILDDRQIYQDRYTNDLSRDGRYLLYELGPEIWYADLKTKEMKPLLKGGAGSYTNGKFSPDGKWVAYTSNESGRLEIYVTSFPAANGKWQISTNGGTQPRWRGDGKELYYMDPEQRIVAVPVSTGAAFDQRSAEVLFQTDPKEMVASSERYVYDVSRDGQRFLVNTKVKSADTQPVLIILNWYQGLGKK